jgi:hypothetical protein
MEYNQEICQSCGIEDDRVEARGIWHCPNALCRGTGGAWFRRTLNSYQDMPNAFEHTVDEKEWLIKGREENKIKGINIENFVNSKNKNKKTIIKHKKSLIDFLRSFRDLTDKNIKFLEERKDIQYIDHYPVEISKVQDLINSFTFAEEE